MSRNSLRPRRSITQKNTSSHFCFICNGTPEVNYFQVPEALVVCTDCLRSAHPSCLKLNTNQTLCVRLEAWQCPDCKCCQVCGDRSHDDQILFCDDCDRGYHTYCLDPPLASVPDGEWVCSKCIESPKKRPKLSDETTLSASASGIKKSIKKTPSKVPPKPSSSSAMTIKPPSAMPLSFQRAIRSRQSTGNSTLDIPFGGKLTFEESDTSKYVPSHRDRSQFDKAKPDSVSLETDTIPKIQMGEYLMDTWFAAPYPQEYNVMPILYLCEYCLKYMKSQWTLDRHATKCGLHHPPGDEIYRDGSLSVFEVDGRKNKEKRSASMYNVSCILTLPIHQRKGFGNFLIDFSYLLSKREGRPGSPEKPLSDLGLLSYRYYWRLTIISTLLKLDPNQSTSVSEISSLTRMTPDDVLSAFELLGIVKQDLEGEWGLHFDRSVFQNYLNSVRAKGYPTVRPECLRWSPFLLLKPVHELEEEPRSGLDVVQRDFSDYLSL